MQNSNNPLLSVHSSKLQVASQASSFKRRALLACGLCSFGLVLALFSFAAPTPNTSAEVGTSTAPRSAAAGTWSIATSPNTTGTENNYLFGVTCASASDCWAVGYSIGIAFQTLIEHWDGISWAIVSSPNTSTTQNNYLYSVTCASASECWAVGFSRNGSVYQTLIEQWNGTSWSIVTSPNALPVQGSSFFSGVTCASASECWAVGYSTANISGIADQTFIARWNGTTWATASSANTSPTQSNYLQAVTCASGSDCWAIGYSVGPPDQNLIEHWDGTSWTIVASPNAGTMRSNQLNDITCVSSSECWAIGYYYNGTANQTLVERWDGTSWTIATSPNTSSTQTNVLSAIACASSPECWAVGIYFTGSTYQTLIEGWDGNSWSIVSSPNVITTRINKVDAVRCSTATDCWAVGYYNADNGVNQTLTEHYTVPLIPTGVVSRMNHGSAGSFDVDLPLTGSPGIECRSGGANGDYLLVFTFANTLASVASANVANGTGSVVNSNIDSNDAHNYIINLSGVTNAQTITVSLTNVTDSTGNFSSAVSTSMGILLGDVNASGRVDAADVSLVRQQTLQTVNTSNFREDINASGRIDAADVSIARQQTLTTLP